MPRNRTWKRSIPLLTKEKNVPEKRKKTFPSFETTKVIEYKLTGADRYCPGLQYEIQGCHKGNRKTAEIHSRTV